MKKYIDTASVRDITKNYQKYSVVCGCEYWAEIETGIKHPIITCERHHEERPQIIIKHVPPAIITKWGKDYMRGY